MTRPMAPDPQTEAVRIGGNVVRIQPRPSLTRSASNRRARLVQLTKRGNSNAMRNGIHAEIQNLPHVADEIALVYASRPDLHPVQDFRLVELLAIATVQHRRAVLAIERDGITDNLTKWEANLGARVERHEQRVHERHLQRVREASAASKGTDLGKYRMGAGA